MLDGENILITGGTGSFGKKFTQEILENYGPEKVIIYSRDEYKQYLMQKQFEGHDNIRFFIGDVRDKDRLYRAFNGVDVVIHAAALKQVPAAEYNPIEAVRTNIQGAVNIVDAAIDRGVEKIVALSTDKAVNPINLYGATKLVSDKLFIAGNAYVGDQDTKFSVVRYGNVSGSRGSVIPFFKSLLDKGEDRLPITDSRMTRFWITLDKAVEMVTKSLKEAQGGELYVRKCPSFRVTDLAEAMNHGAELENIGIRPGEKLHEVMVPNEDSKTTYEYGDHFIIYPNFDWWDFDKHLKAGGKKVPEDFKYSSNNNTEWLSTDDLRELLETIDIVY